MGEGGNAEYQEEAAPTSEERKSLKLKQSLFL
jgi:hypothetical protein